MNEGLFEIKAYNHSYNQQLISVWERAVLATHSFLLPSDFEEIKEMVTAIDFNAFPVFCLLNENNVVGFIGIDEKKVEMLFLAPDYFGKGLGKKLMRFAMKELRADKVDVNEQNGDAVAFYKKLGFETYERTEKDMQGKNYPILKMRLKDTQL